MYAPVIYAHVAYSAPSHYLNQIWFIVNWTIRDKIKWKFCENSNIFTDEYAFENVICKKKIQNFNINWAFYATVRSPMRLIIFYC